LGVVKEGENPWKCAVVTLHRWLPVQSTQIAAARSWGIPELHFKHEDMSAIWVDDVLDVRRTTNWASYLTDRADLINGLKRVKGRGDSVFFMNPLAVGFSQKHAETVIDQIFRWGHMVYIHDMGLLFREDDDLSDFMAEHARQLKAAQMRDYRNKKST